MRHTGLNWGQGLHVIPFRSVNSYFLCWKGFPVAMCMSNDLSSSIKQRKVSTLTPWVPLERSLWLPLPQLKETMFVWRQACPSHLGGHCRVLSLKTSLCVFWACLSLLLACAEVRFPSFRASFWVRLVLGTLNIHEVMYYLFQSWGGYKNILHWQCLWIAFIISSPHHPHIYFLSSAFLQ